MTQIGIDEFVSYGHMAAKIQSENAMHVIIILWYNGIIYILHRTNFLGEGFHRLCLLPNPFEFINKLCFQKKIN